jgi:hypothetical protein
MVFVGESYDRQKAGIAPDGLKLAAFAIERVEPFANVAQADSGPAA